MSVYLKNLARITLLLIAGQQGTAIAQNLALAVYDSRPPNDQTISAATGTIPEFKKVGSGSQEVLLIPCASCRWNVWQEFMERNKELYTMYAITLPGNGGTPVPTVARNSGKTPWHNNAIEAISRFVDEHRIKDLTVVGHSWGSTIAVEFAAKRGDVVKRLINVDGAIENSSWRPKTLPERDFRAKTVVETWAKKFEGAEEWRLFNSVRLPPGPSLTPEQTTLWMNLHGSFMATSKDVVLQYWRENILLDLTELTASLRMPILDLKCVNGENMETKRDTHLENLKAAGIASKVKTVFFYETSHFVMFHRPLELDRVVRDFLAGKEPVGFGELRKSI